MRERSEVTLYLKQYLVWLKKTTQGHPEDRGEMGVDLRKTIQRADGLRKLCDAEGVVRQREPLYELEDTALLRNRWGHLAYGARAMLMTAGMHIRFWPLAFSHQNYIINRIASVPVTGLGGAKKIDFVSPFEKMMVAKQANLLKDLKIFGSTAYCHVI